MEKAGRFTFRIILTQGLNRQIRRMCTACGYRVKSLKRIRAYAFCCCGLTSVVVPAHVEEIECGAFKRCVALHSVVLPEGLRVIGSDAFAGCKALKTVVLPEGL